MRLTCFLLLACCLSVSARGFSQKVSLKANGTSMGTVFKTIQKQTGYVFFYDEALLQSAEPVFADLNGVPLEEALKICFREQPLTYSVIGKTVVVKRKTGAGLPEELPPVEVKGIVRNDKGEPLEGVTLLIKGSTKGRTTDKNGEFEFKDIEPGTVLVVSAVGHESKEVTVKNGAYLSIVLTVKVNEMEATVTVSTGYQQIKKTNVAGSVSTIKASELAFNGVNTIEQALQGRLPGVVVLNNNGMVGTRQRTIVRGVSTLTGSQDPIWVVDGMIQEDPLPFKASTLDGLGNISPDNFDFVRNFVGNAIAWLNPNDIEDITVLKDASATAIYGVRAGNGVIVINTKKGKEGPPVVSYSNTVNIGERVTYDRLEKMNSKQRVAVSREVFERGLTSTTSANNIGYAGALDDYLFGRATYEQFNARVKQLEVNNVDWFDILFRTPVSVNHNLNLSGGNASTRYYSSFGYSTNNGTAKGNDQRTFTANVGLNTRLGRKINASIRVSGNQAETNGFFKMEPYKYASEVNRAIPAYDSSGSLSYYKLRSGFLFNAINELENSGSANKSMNVNANLNLNYDISRNIRFNTMFSISSSNTNGYTYASERTEYIAKIRMYDYGTVRPTDAAFRSSKLPIGGEYNADDNQKVSWNWRNNISYSKVFALKHTFSAMLGQEANSVHYTGFATTNYGYLPERGKSFVDLPVSTTIGSIVTPNSLLLTKKVYTDRVTNTMGLYGTLNYAFDNRYVLNASVRSDASNRFGQFTGEKFNPVYALGLRYNLMYEPFVKNLAWLSAFSLRATYGFQRNIVSNVSPELIARVNSSVGAQATDLMTGEPRLVVSSLPYGDLRWEKTATTNFGLDFGFLNNRVSGTVEYYTKKGRDIITSLDVPIEYGVTTMPVNGGELSNKGLEVSMAFIPVQKKDYTLTVSFNTSKVFNKLERAGAQNPNFRTASNGSYYLDGYPVSGFWAFRFDGIDQTNGTPKIDLTVDSKRDPLTDPSAYMQYMGTLNPDLTAGSSVSFRYKMFSVATSLYLQLGGYKFLTPVYVVGDNQAAGLPTEYENLSAELTNRWTPTNTTASFPGLPTGSANFALPDGKTYSNVYQMYNYSTARVVDASTLRMNSISLSYNLPGKIVSALRAKNLSAGVSASNVFAWVSKDFKGRDAEVATGAQPRTRSFSFRINASF